MFRRFLIGCILAVSIGFVATRCVMGNKVCPPAAKTCIKVDFVQMGTSQFSSNCEVVKVDQNNDKGWTYSDDYAFNGWGVFAWQNKVPGDPIDGLRQSCEYRDPDCPTAGNPQKPSDYPSTAKTSFLLGEPMPYNFKRCCEDPQTSNPTP